MNKKLLFKNTYQNLLFKSRYLKKYGIPYGVDVNKINFNRNFNRNFIFITEEMERLREKVKFEINVQFKKSRKWKMFKKRNCKLYEKVEE